jgi:hypothetical protein
MESMTSRTCIPWLIQNIRTKMAQPGLAIGANSRKPDDAEAKVFHQAE